jgi:hypothetical protein
MRSNKPRKRRPDHNSEQVLHELDRLQSLAPLPDIEPPQLIDQAVRNMARREMPNRPVTSLAGKLSWIAGLSTVSIALIAVGLSMVQSPPLPPPETSPAAPALHNEQPFETGPAVTPEPRNESRAKSRLAKERSALQAVSSPSERTASSHDSTDQALSDSSTSDEPEAEVNFKQTAPDASPAEPALESQSPEEISGVAVAGAISDMDQASAESAQAWLDLIRQLYDQGLLAEATKQLSAFRADHPEHPLPDWAAELQP